MPDGDRSSFKHKIPNMLAKLFSFFKWKHRIYKKVDEVQIEEELNYWSHYKNLKAEEIMVPRTDIVAMDYSNNLEDITRIFLENRHTRMPVFKGELDNIVGFVNIKDIFPYLVKPKENPKFNIDNVLRKLLVVSPAMKLFDLLEEMKKDIAKCNIFT